MKWAYYCERCRTIFPVDVSEDVEAVPEESTCPQCEYPHAVKLYPVRGLGSQIPSGGCAPASGC